MPNRPFSQIVYPLLFVRNVEESYRYYTQTLGFLPGATYPGPDGKIGHAEVSLGSVTFMFARQDQAGMDPAVAKTTFAENTKKGAIGGVSLYVNLACASVDQYYKMVRERGAKTLAEPQTQFWGDRMFAVTDPDGHLLNFAETVAELDPSKAPK